MYIAVHPAFYRCHKFAELVDFSSLVLLSEYTDYLEQQVDRFNVAYAC